MSASASGDPALVLGGHLVAEAELAQHAHHIPRLDDARGGAGAIAGRRERRTRLVQLGQRLLQLAHAGDAVTGAREVLTVCFHTCLRPLHQLGRAALRPRRARLNSYEDSDGEKKQERKLATR